MVNTMKNQSYIALLEKMLHLRVKIGAKSLEKTDVVKKHKSLLNKAKMQLRITNGK